MFKKVTLPTEATECPASPTRSGEWLVQKAELPARCAGLCNRTHPQLYPRCQPDVLLALDSSMG